MELPNLVPQSEVQPPGYYFSRLPSLQLGLPEVAEEEAGGETIHVAVGKSLEKSVKLLHWTFRRFKNRDIGLVHVHQPSPTIPTLLGKLPASHANEGVVKAYRKQEREETNRLLSNYLDICCRAKVKATIFMIECVNVQKGIVELVNKHAIRKLVMGGGPDNCMKVRRSTSKANYATINTPAFCGVWFVNKGRCVWTKEASEDLNMFVPIPSSAEHAQEEKLKSTLSFSHMGVQEVHPTLLGIDSCPSWGGVGNLIKEDHNLLGVALSPDELDCMGIISKSTSSAGYTSADTNVSSEFGEEESSCNELLDARKQDETSKDGAFAELLQHRMLEVEVEEANNKAKIFKSAHTHEAQQRI